MNHTDDSIKQLFNELVDAELGPARPAPAFADDQPGSVRQWRVPLAAATVLALLATGSVLAIDNSRKSKAGPATVPISRSVSPTPVDTSAAFFARYPEAAGIPGVTVRPVSAAEAKKYRPATIIVLPGLPEVLTAGKSYTATMEYVSTAADDPTMVISLAATDVASENCPPPFLGHAGHTYVIACTFVPRADATGKLTLKLSTPAGYSSGSTPLRTH